MNLYFKNRMMKAGLLSLMAGAAVLLPIVANAESYTVKSGDTLSAIAASHQTTVDKIAQKNKISNINLISVGQVLELDDDVSEQMTVEKSDKAEQSTVNPSSGLSTEDAEAKEWIAQKEYSAKWAILWSLSVDYRLSKWRFITRKSREDSGCLCSRSLWLMVGC